MSEWHVEVVKVGNVSKHPNADTLSVTQVHDGYPVVFKTGEVVEGQRAIYIPVESLLPDTDEWSFVKGRRVRAVRIRGVTSQGLIVPITQDLETKAALAGVSLEPGSLVHELLGITKREPVEDERDLREEEEPGPDGWEFVRYTDIKGLRRYKHVIPVGEHVVITEKIHGSNARFCWDGERLWCGSRKQVKKEDDKTFWWQYAKRLQLAECLKNHPKIIFFGELFGHGVQDLDYGMICQSFTVFDTYNVSEGRFCDWHETKRLATEAGFPIVPVLYEGYWKGFDEHKDLAEGQSTLAGHVREGFVVKPTRERYLDRFGRVILKLIGDSYLFRKD